MPISLTWIQKKKSILIRLLIQNMGKNLHLAFLNTHVLLRPKPIIPKCMKVRPTVMGLCFWVEVNHQLTKKWTGGFWKYFCWVIQKPRTINPFDVVITMGHQILHFGFIERSVEPNLQTKTRLVSFSE